MTSTLRFTGGRRVDITQYALMASIGQARPSRWSVRLALGSVLDGALEADARTHEIGPGLVGSVSLAKLWSAQAWFVTGSIGLSASRISTGLAQSAAPREHLSALDGRIGAVAGRTFGIASPYLLLRGFGGPVSWRLDGEDVSGSDTHHYQLGAGASIVAGRGLSVTLDIAAIGEQGASLGVAVEL